MIYLSYTGFSLAAILTAAAIAAYYMGNHKEGHASRLCGQLWLIIGLLAWIAAK